MQRNIDKVFLTITNICNNKCSYCFQDGNKVDNMSLESFIKVIDRLNKIGIKKLILSGGEASMHPGFLQILKVLDRCDFETNLFSNGILNDDIIKQINDSSIKKVYISLDGTNELYNSSRGKANIKTVENSINLLNKKIIIMNTLNAKNYKNTKDFLVYCSRFKNVEKVNFNPIKILHPCYSDLALTNEMLNEANQVICDFLNGANFLVRSYYNYYSDVVMNCGAAKNSIAVDSNGDVSGCIFGSSVDKNTFVVGNLFEEDLTEIWQDMNRWKNYFDLEEKGCNGCKNMSRCTGVCSIEKYLVNNAAEHNRYLCNLR